MLYHVPMPRIYAGVLLWTVLAPGLLRAQDVTQAIVYRGTVTLDDGSIPGHLVSVVRVCEGLEPIREGVASGKTGQYYIRLNVNSFYQAYGSVNVAALLPCRLEADDKGFVSSSLDLTDTSIMRNPVLPTIVLTPKMRVATLGSESHATVPHKAAKSWNQGIRLATARNWAAAETPMRAVVQTAPNFAPGWSGLGMVLNNLGKPDEAAGTLKRAIQLDPKPLSTYMLLAGIQVDLKDWQGAEATAKSLIDADKKHTYVEIHLLSAIALYQSHDFEGALAAIDDAIRFDKLHQLPRAEYIQGLILEAKGDLPGAGEHLRNYIQQHPKAKDIATANQRLANLGKSPLADLSTEMTSLDMRAAAAGEAPVPGGIKAFSAVAKLNGNISFDNFFLEYCRGIAEETPTRDAGEDVRTYLATVAALEALGERHENGTLIRLSLNNDDQVRKTRAILTESGWKLTQKGDGYTLDPGDRHNDDLRQWTLVCLGVDELTLRQAIQEKRDFSFEIPRENARLVGGAAWGVLLKGVPDSPGGPIEVFTTDWRFAKVYTGLAAMDGDAAAAVVSAIGLNNLIVKYSRLTEEFGEAVALDGNHVGVPGGVQAEPVWAKLAGAKPENPVAFLRALFDKDQGRLLAFYYDLSHADEPRRQYFTHSSDRAEAFYNWYRDSIPTLVVPRTIDRWQSGILQKVIDGSGKVNFPGGHEAWGARSDNADEILAHRVPAPAIAVVSELERKRGAPLSTRSGQLLAQHYTQWRNLFPYFEKLPGLDDAAFGALAAFADDAQKAPPARREFLVGEWNSLVELIVMGAQAGSLSSVQTAQLFRQACEAMQSPNPSAKAIETLRAMTGGAADLDEAVPTRLLKLNAARLDAFGNVKRLQGVPLFRTLGESPDAAKAAAALSGTVYAALLDPAYLLVAEDPHLVSKHTFVPLENPDPGIFARSWLAASSDQPGSKFQGGFSSFEETARQLRKQTVGPLLAPPEGAPPPQLETGPAEEPTRPEEHATAALRRPGIPRRRPHRGGLRHRHRQPRPLCRRPGRLPVHGERRGPVQAGIRLREPHRGSLGSAAVRHYRQHGRRASPAQKRRHAVGGGSASHRFGGGLQLQRRGEGDAIVHHGQGGRQAGHPENPRRRSHRPLRCAGAGQSRSQQPRREKSHHRVHRRPRQRQHADVEHRHRTRESQRHSHLYHRGRRSPRPPGADPGTDAHLAIHGREPLPDSPPGRHRSGFRQGLTGPAARLPGGLPAISQ